MSTAEVTRSRFVTLTYMGFVIKNIFGIEYLLISNIQSGFLFLLKRVSPYY